MSAYVEVMTEGNRRAFLEAAAVAGVITSPGKTLFDEASESAPIAIVIRGSSQTIAVVSGSGSLFLARCALVRQRYKNEEDPRTGQPYIVLVDYIESVKEVDETAVP